MKQLIAILLLCFTAPTFAMTVGGVKVSDKVRVESANLVLNGAGVRSKMMFNIYVGALYLTEKKKTAEAVLADHGVKRVSLHIMRHLTAGDFLEAFINAVRANNNTQEMAELSGRLVHFSRVFRAVGEVDKGDVIILDYLPEVGTVLTVKGKELDDGRIKGEDFFRALLKVWLGNKPVQDSLKDEMLGSAS